MAKRMNTRNLVRNTDMGMDEKLNTKIALENMDFGTVARLSMAKPAQNMGQRMIESRVMTRSMVLVVMEGGLRGLSMGVQAIESLSMRSLIMAMICQRGRVMGNRVTRVRKEGMESPLMKNPVMGSLMRITLSLVMRGVIVVMSIPSKAMVKRFMAAKNMEMIALMMRKGTIVTRREMMALMTRKSIATRRVMMGLMMRKSTIATRREMMGLMMRKKTLATSITTARTTMTSGHLLTRIYACSSYQMGLMSLLIITK